MRILHIITGLGDGGAEAVLSRLITTDRADSHHVISLLDEGTYGVPLAAAGIPVYVLRMPRGRATPAGLVKLYRLMRQIRPDVVQTWMYHADLLGGIVARLAGTRALVWGIRNASLDSRTTTFTTRLVARASALGSRSWPRRIISCSSRAAEMHIRLGYDCRKMVVIPNGYDLTHFAPDLEMRARLRAEWNFGPGMKVLGMVARWDPAKDHRTLLSALTVLGAKGVGGEWRCMLVGTGIEEGNTALRELLAQCGIGERVSLLGPRRDIPAVMNALDLHVLSSASESFPNVVAEAMGCGTPCVVTDVGDAGLIVGDTGWVVSPHDPTGLAQGVDTALVAMRDYPAAWQTRQRSARDRIETHFSLDRMVRAYSQVWHAAAAE